MTYDDGPIITLPPRRPPLTIHIHGDIIMTFTFRRLGALVAILALTLGTARAQDDLAAQLSKLGAQAAPLYVSPLLNGFSVGMNSAFYHSADLHGVLGFDVGVKIAAARVEDADKTFTLDLPATIVYNGTTFTRGTHYPDQVTSQTAVGAKTTTDVKTIAPAGPGGAIPTGTTILTLPKGFDLPAVGAPFIPQVAVGLPFGLEVIGRFAPTMNAGDAGKFSYSGFGLRYDVDQWLPLFPIDIAVHFGTQKMTFKDKADKDIFSASASAYGVEVSKGIIFLTVYGGFQLESSEISVSDFVGYEPTTGAQVTVPGFTVEGKNKSRLTVGARMLLLFLNVHAEYSVATTPVFALGVGISFR
ncbi:MAG: hypothetical protein A3H45_10895 [Ignavibacteria bacterium RIFCSPLOWO2_02_FULL_55_14]|nr:MAG: hypothetical protein A3C56_02835 [Ignavibacteria bacterium RIFCSPHIGHO2_02_FULL_56_12]OGU72606.1 MAG: hypothetical protein A3G43_08225 [Ignavibacteria bacterium RIFCSPLOWO2_12_FULL_56_21]OGU74549.1 MAG: hypothetical protein A3H45_10895 [Ignavibacteria bacterium RIFCSPLOWO2_02_FULL_55_14]